MNQTLSNENCKVVGGKLCFALGDNNNIINNSIIINKLINIAIIIRLIILLLVVKIYFFASSFPCPLVHIDISVSLLCLQDKVASESLPLQGFTVKLSDRSEGDDTDSVFQLYHKKTLYYTFRADDQHTARRYNTKKYSCGQLWIL